MAPKLYYMDVSPPARSVLLTAKALNLDLELMHVDLLAGKHKTPEFKKLNPQNTVPTLDDDGYLLWDSHAIIAYLADKYGKDDSLYPKDLEKRGTINQRLHFNGGVVQRRMRLILRRLFLGEITQIPEDKAKDILDTYELLESFLMDQEFMAGKTLTIADLSLISTISSLDPIIPIDRNKCPKLSRWLIRMQALPYYNEANQSGLDKYVGAIRKNLK